LIANLADNALRHNTPGGHVEVVTRTKDSHAVLSVINTGAVIPAAAIDRLLQPFQRLGSDRTGHRSAPVAHLPQAWGSLPSRARP
jgi:signal transduction histidine kinase